MPIKGPLLCRDLDATTARVMLAKTAAKAVKAFTANMAAEADYLNAKAARFGTTPLCSHAVMAQQGIDTRLAAAEGNEGFQRRA